MSRSFVAFGGNQGHVAKTFRDAALRLERTPGVRIAARSRLYRTAAIGESAGGAYFNAMVAVDTTLEPEELLSVVQSIEDSCGRIRTTHWGPRTLDLDLIAFDAVVLSSPRLTIPHPHDWYRRFVLDPWNDIAPDFVHPVLQESVARMRQRLTARPLPIAVVAEMGEVRGRLASIPGVRIVENDAGETVIRFVIGQSSSRHRTIDLSTADDPPVIAEQIVRAALDEPIVVAPDDWIEESAERPPSAG
jgi:2-amino-4-hydroxy-6-hydroxymethyldihydropteridine diphosphokinase